jgi:ferrochelatase
MITETEISMKQGLLLINLGTPTDPTPAAVRTYLREFLSDARVVTLPALLRYLILHAFILPFRPKQSAHAYQAIWTEQGSPLRVHSEALRDQLQQELNDSHTVVLAMRYGEPSIKNALHQLRACPSISVLPLFPQYASATTGSCLEYLMTLLRSELIFPSLHIIRDFHAHPGFIQAQAALIKPHIESNDYILFSYHGLPCMHLKKIGCNPVCAHVCPTPLAANQACYRAQCQETTRLLAETLDLNDKQHSMAFQSRLGRTPWIKPYTDFVLPELAAQGIKRLAVACPSFVADCLETLEEIGLRAKQQWLELGGESFTLIPCVNDHHLFVDSIKTMLHLDYNE